MSLGSFEMVLADPPKTSEGVGVSGGVRTPLSSRVRNEEAAPLGFGTAPIGIATISPSVLDHKARLSDIAFLLNREPGVTLPPTIPASDVAQPRLEIGRAHV